MEEVTRTAVITAIDNTVIRMKVINCPACQGCAAQKFCGLTETAGRELSANVPDAAFFKVGEEINVTLTPGIGLKAVFYGYALPLILLLLTVVVLSLAGAGDFTCGISGIIVLIPYYFGLFLLKDRMKTDFQFKISKKNDLQRQNVYG